MTTSKLTTLAATLASAQIASAAIFTDTFDSGTGNWYKAYNGTGSDATTLANDTGRLSFTAGSVPGGFEVIGRSFTSQTIGVGETISLSFDFQQTAATGILRVGFYDLSIAAPSADDWANSSTGTFDGYTTFIRDSGSNVARIESDSFTATDADGYPTRGVEGGTDITSSGGGDNFTFLSDGSDYQFTFSVTRT